MILGIASIGIVLLTFTIRANAQDQKAGIYVSPAVEPVMVEELPAIPGQAPMQLMANLAPSRILLIGKGNRGTHYRQPTQLNVVKPTAIKEPDESEITSKTENMHHIAEVGVNSDVVHVLLD